LIGSPLQGAVLFAEIYLFQDVFGAFLVGGPGLSRVFASHTIAMIDHELD